MPEDQSTILGYVRYGPAEHERRLRKLVEDIAEADRLEKVTEEAKAEYVATGAVTLGGEVYQAQKELADAINPAHYQGFSNGAQVIDIVENLVYNRGAAVKYLARAGKKDIADELEDLRKAQWYVAREIERIEATR